MFTDKSLRPTVTKIGGSLFGTPRLFDRLREFIGMHGGPTVVLVPGGGHAADIVRAWDARHQFGEEVAHWLALRAMTFNAYFLAAGFGAGAVVSGQVDQWPELWDKKKAVVVDAFEFATVDESNPAHLPHRWSVTSDSVAARVAHVVGAQTLYLLKSTTLEAGVGWLEAGQRGFVDSTFAEVLADLNAVPIDFLQWAPEPVTPNGERARHR